MSSVRRILGVGIIMIFPLIGDGQTMNMTAKAGGMGNAWIGLAEGAGAVYYNPAGIVGLDKMSADVGFGWEGFPLMENWSALYAKPFYSATYMGLGFIRRNIAIDSKEYHCYQMIIPTTNRFSNTTSGGMNFKMMTQKSGSDRYVSKFGMDAGLTLNSGDFRLSLAARDFLYLKMAGFQPEYSAGWGYEGDKFSFEVDLFSGDWNEIPTENSGYRAGGEINLSDYYCIRCGLEEKGGEKIISVGSGILSLFKTYGFDYCYRGAADNFNGGTHWFSYTYRSP